MTKSRKQRRRAAEVRRLQELEAANPNHANAVRFCYPNIVTLAYDGDLDRAAADTDEQVAATVTAFERAHGVEPRDWTVEPLRTQSNGRDAGQ